ncbi:MAG: hypothetical protein WD557_03745 [Dehalococcoidia bacterium]
MTTAIPFCVAQDPPPLRVREDGEVVASQSGARYDYFMAWYLRGDTPEELMEALPELSRGEIDRLIGYYHEHQKDVDAWLAEIDREEQEAIRKWEEKFPPQVGLRAKLEKRLAEMRATHPD